MTGDQIDPLALKFSEPRYFEDFEVGERFYLPSRTMTEGVFSAFQAASGDNHPIHYDRHYCQALGHRDLLAHGYQVLIQACVGAGVLPQMISAIDSHTGEPHSLLDIGGGIGSIQHEMMAAGVEVVINVDAAPEYQAVVRQEAEAHGYADRITYCLGDFVDLAPDIEVTDVVTLDRVICCYPHMRVLVSSSAAKAKALYGLVFPREHRLMRVVFGAINLFNWMKRSAFRLHLHPSADVEDELRRCGFRRVFDGRTILWQVRLYEREAEFAHA